MVMSSTRRVWLLLFLTVTCFLCQTTSVPVEAKHKRSTNEDHSIQSDTAPYQDLSISDADDSPALGVARNDQFPSDVDQDQSQFLQQDSDGLDQDSDQDLHGSDDLFDSDAAQSREYLPGSHISHSDLQTYDGNSEIAIGDHDRTEQDIRDRPDASSIDSQNPDTTFNREGQHYGPTHAEAGSLNHDRRDLDNTTDGHFLLTEREGRPDKGQSVISTDSHEGFLLDHGMISGIHAETHNESISRFTHDQMMVEKVTNPQNEHRDISEPEVTTIGVFDHFHEIHAVNNQDNYNNDSDSSYSQGEERANGDQSYGNVIHENPDGRTAIDKDDGNRHSHGRVFATQSSTQNVDGSVSTAVKIVNDTNTPRLAILPTPSQIDNGESQNLSVATTSSHSIITGQGETHINGNNAPKSGSGEYIGSNEQSTEGPQNEHIISGEGHIGTGGEVHEGSGNEHQGHDTDGNEETGHTAAVHEPPGEENHEHEGQTNEGSGHAGQHQTDSGHEGQGNRDTGHGSEIHEGSGHEGQPHSEPHHEGEGHENQGHENSEGSGTDEENTGHKDEKNISKGGALKEHTTHPVQPVEQSVHLTPSSISSERIVPTSSKHPMESEYKIQSSRISEPIESSHWHHTSSIAMTTASIIDEFESLLHTTSISDSTVGPNLPSKSTTTVSITTVPSFSANYINPTLSYKPTNMKTHYLNTIEASDLSTLLTSTTSKYPTRSFSSTVTRPEIAPSLSSTFSSEVSSSSFTTHTLLLTSNSHSTQTATTSTQQAVTEQSTRPSSTTPEPIMFKTTRPATILTTNPDIPSGTSRSTAISDTTTASSTKGQSSTQISKVTNERTTTPLVPLLTIGTEKVRTTTSTTGRATRLTTILITKKQETDKPTEKPDFVPTSGRPMTLPGQQTSRSPATTNAIVSMTTLRPITPQPYTTTDKPQKPHQTTPPPMFIEIEIRMTWQEFCSMKTNFIASLQETIRTEKQVIVRDEQFKIQNLPKQYCSMANAITINDESVSRRITIQMYIVDDAGKIDVQLTYDVSSVIIKGFQDTIFKDKIVAVKLVKQSADVDQQSPESSARRRESSVTMVVVIASVGGLCCLILVVLQLVLIHRRITTKAKQRALQNLAHRSMDNVALGAMPKSRPHSGYWNPALEDDDEFDPLQYSHVLNYSTLANFCTDSNGIYDEFQDVPCDNAGLTKLFVGEDDKNRFANVLPHSHSRIKLKKRIGDASDYINASSIKGYKGTSDTYIATQSPLVNTVEDFWRMVWEQQSRCIIMLNPILPSGKYKQSTCYWPDNLATDSFRQYGDYTVALKKRDIQKDYIECTLEITDIERNLKREIHHFLLTCWPDIGTPEPLSIVKFVLDTRPYYENSGAPAIVHCGPGTGRTGVFIALDTCMRTYEKRKHVDVFNCVYRMRKERLGMVQTKEQYSLIYQALNQYAVILGSPSFSTRSSVISLHAML